MSDTTVNSHAAEPGEWDVGPMPDDFALPLKRETRDGATWVSWPGTDAILPLEYRVNEGLESHPEEELHLRLCAWNCVEWFRMGRLDLLKGQLRDAR
jgi:hypothetical protein